MSIPLILLIGGFLIGVLSVVIGGGFFFSIPLMQWIFPELGFGAIIGNLKVGSLARGAASTLETRRRIRYRECFVLALPLCLGTLVGVTAIAHLSQRWVLPAILLAVVMAECAPRIARHVTQKRFLALSSVLGVYTGFLGAGVGVMITSLLRLKYPEDEEIAQLKIDTRFVEFLLVTIAVVAHLLHGNLFMGVWLWWSIGSFLGGMSGARLLTSLGKATARMQKRVLRVSYVLATVMAGLRFRDAD